MNRHRALGYCFEHDLCGKPLHTFPDHALVSWRLRLWHEKTSYWRELAKQGSPSLLWLRQVLTEQAFVAQFDWEYNLLLALSLALVVLGVIGVLYLAI